LWDCEPPCAFATTASKLESFPHASRTYPKEKGAVQFKCPGARTRSQVIGGAELDNAGEVGIV